jgi:4'-phosphopantetheinyl transferase EntD
LPVGTGREPCWPAQVTGSISHTTGYCVAVAARTSSIASIGVDAEAEIRLETTLWELVLTARERAWVESLPPEIRGVGAQVVFSAKESVYKCQYPLSRTFLEFRDVELECEPVVAPLAAGRFVAHLPIPSCPRLSGFWRSSEERVETVTWLPLSIPGRTSSALDGAPL